MTILIIIPARKGSRRLKKKNKKNFLGKPLISHTIEFAKKLKFKKKILVSTDDTEILKIGKKYNVLVPWLRPKKLSTSKSKSISFTFHALNWFRKNSIKINTIILLQPTSPYRSIRTLNKMLEIYKKNKKSIVTVTTDLRKNKKKLFIYKNKLIKKINKLTQKKYISVNIVGNIYINSVNNLNKYKDFVNQDSVAYLVKNKKELIDIDTHQDFKSAKKLFIKNKRG